MPRRSKATAYEKDQLEEPWLREIIKLAEVNGWRWDVEDCFPEQQPGTSFFLKRWFKSLTTPLQFLFGRKKNYWTLAYHTYDSRRSQKGLPDLILIHPRRGILLIVETKKEGEYPKTEQRLWLAAFEVVAAHAPTVIIVKLWRPSDRPEVVDTLGGIDYKLF